MKSPIGALQYQISPGDGLSSVPERVGPVRATQLRPLRVSGLPPQSTGSGSLALHWEEDKFPPEAVEVPCRGRPPVYGAIEGRHQATKTVAAPPIVDISINMAYHQCQDIVTSAQLR